MLGHVTLYCTWRPSVLLTGPHGQVSPVPHTPYLSLPNTCLLFTTRPYHRNLFRCSTKIVSSILSLSQLFMVAL